jgi:NAD(P)H dehydrogenase (quinone)
VRWLVVHAHPDPDSYSAALRDSAIAGLEAGGAETRMIDLYALGFKPAMNDDEHRRYEEVANEHPDPLVAEHIEHLAWAEALLFVYPTWWGTLPAMLKGWLDRVLLPSVAFKLDDTTRKVRPGLTNVRRITAITTYGAPRWQVRLLGDGVRTILGRTLRLVCHRRSRVTFLSLDQLDGRSDIERQHFLEEVTRKLKAIA